MIRHPNDKAPKFFTVATVLATVATSGYFAVGGLIAPATMVPGGDTVAAHVFAEYPAVRSLVLLGALLWFTARRAWRPLSLVLILNGVVQLLDTTVGLVHHQIPQTIGPLVFAAALFGSALALRRTATTTA